MEYEIKMDKRFKVYKIILLSIFVIVIINFFVRGQWFLGLIFSLAIILLYKVRFTQEKRTGPEEYERLKREVIGEEAYRREKEFERQVERNLMGIKLEKEGKVDEAIELYEQNVRENFEGNHPYDRLSIIYRKRNQIDEEIRVLEKAIWVFENVVYKERGDRVPKLEKFKVRLKKAKALKDKKRL